MNGICGVQEDSARADAGIDAESIINIINIIKNKGLACGCGHAIGRSHQKCSSAGNKYIME